MLLCLGMYGSTSTWMFNVVQQLAAALHPGRPLTGCYVGETARQIEATEGLVVVKAHAPLEPAPLVARAQAIFMTLRDPRDAVASVMAYNRWPFEYALPSLIASAELCAAHAGDARVCLLRFGDRFFDVETTVDRLAARLGGAISAADRTRVFAANRREAVERFIAGLDHLPTAMTEYSAIAGRSDTYDRRTHWHRHHAGRTGRIGRWRDELAAAQVERIEKRLAAWMQRFGYPTAEEAAFLASLGWGAAGAPAGA